MIKLHPQFNLKLVIRKYNEITETIETFKCAFQIYYIIALNQITSQLRNDKEHLKNENQK